MSLATFVLRYLPPAPARVLEIGCGPVGDLTYAIAAAGYAIVAVDPVAPEGPLFRRIPFEDFTEPGPFDAVVASLSMHHIADLPRTADRIVISSCRVGGSFWKSGTASACSMRRRRAGISTNGTPPRPRVCSPGMRRYLPRYEEWRRAWLADHGDLHGYTAMRAQLMAPFRERFFTWRPYLYRYGLHESLEPLERALIEEGAIQATGFRWVGERNPPS